MKQIVIYSQADTEMVEIICPIEVIAGDGYTGLCYCSRSKRADSSETIGTKTLSCLPFAGT